MCLVCVCEADSKPFVSECNKSAFSLVNSAVNTALPAFVAECCSAAPLLPGARRPQLSLDISCPHGAQQQTRLTPLLRSNDGTDRPFICKPVYYADSANKPQTVKV